MMSEGVSLRGIETVLQSLALREEDFAAGDAVVGRIALLRSAIDEIDSAKEPWLAAWLSEEHYKGAVLYAAAKTSWNHEQIGKGTLADRRMRAQIVARFNSWVEQFRGRVSEYEHGPHAASAVTEWRAGLRRFKEDPVHNG